MELLTMLNNFLFCLLRAFILLFRFFSYFWYCLTVAALLSRVPTKPSLTNDWSNFFQSNFLRYSIYYSDQLFQPSFSARSNVENLYIGLFLPCCLRSGKTPVLALLLRGTFATTSLSEFPGAALEAASLLIWAAAWLWLYFVSIVYRMSTILCGERRDSRFLYHPFHPAWMLEGHTPLQCEYHTQIITFFGKSNLLDHTWKNTG